MSRAALPFQHGIATACNQGMEVASTYGPSASLPFALPRAGVGADPRPNHGFLQLRSPDQFMEAASGGFCRGSRTGCLRAAAGFTGIAQIRRLGEASDDGRAGQSLRNLEPEHLGETARTTCNWR